MLEATKKREISGDRRRILLAAGWGLIGIFLTTVVSAMVRFFFPRTILEPPTRYKIGFPSQYPAGVSERFKKQFRIWIIREVDRLYVVEAKCTHLGCTPNWLAAEGKFKCPCHGSVYDVDGKVLAGPAPRRLDVLPSKVEDGRLFVMYKEYKAGLSTSVEL